MEGSYSVLIVCYTSPEGRIAIKELEGFRSEEEANFAANTIREINAYHTFPNRTIALSTRVTVLHKGKNQ